MSRLVCGLDVGISTTDAVAGWARGRSLSLPTVAAVESADEALRRLLALAPPPRRADVAIAATGAGMHRLPEELAGFRVKRVPEIEAIARGGLGLTDLAEALVVSLGTGTALVSVRPGEVRHLVPGSGIGGGTLLALARSLLGTDDLRAFVELARDGERGRLDITLGEALGGPLGALPASATASNLAKIGRDARREDVAAALANLVTEVVLTITLHALRASRHERAVLVGKLVQLEPIARRTREISESLGGIFIVPDEAGVATALGAMWALEEGR